MTNVRGKVIVRGKNILQAPLLESNEANLIEFYNADGHLIAFFVRIFTDDTWGFCTKEDKDWPEMCVRYGFSSLKAGTGFKDVITEGVRPFIHGDAA